MTDANVFKLAQPGKFTRFCAAGAQALRKQAVDAEVADSERRTDLKTEAGRQRGRAPPGVGR